MATEEALAIQRAEQEAAELAVLQSIDARLARIEAKLNATPSEAPKPAGGK